MSLGKYLRDPALAVRKVRWRLLYDGPQRDVTVSTYNGLLTFDSRDKLIGKYLYVQRAYERRYLEGALDYLAARGWFARDGRGTVLDIGANIGMIAIALLRHGWFARAVAFEPAPGNLRLLRHNVVQNGLAERITVIPAALSAAPGEMELELSEYNSGDNRIRESAAGGAWHEDRRATVRVPVRRLDDALAEAGVDAADVRLAWVDIQGHEGRLFAGGRRTFAQGFPVVSEFWPYGIARSGITPTEYAVFAATLFTHVVVLHPGAPERLPIARLPALFDRYPAPRQMAEIILLREPR